MTFNDVTNLLSLSSYSLFHRRQFFDGNNGVFSDESVVNLFPVTFMARYFRLVFHEWEKGSALRFEILGCQGELLSFNVYSNLLQY